MKRIVQTTFYRTPVGPYYGPRPDSTSHYAVDAIDEDTAKHIAYRRTIADFRTTDTAIKVTGQSILADPAEIARVWIVDLDDGSCFEPGTYQPETPRTAERTERC